MHNGTGEHPYQYSPPTSSSAKHSSARHSHYPQSVAVVHDYPPNIPLKTPTDLPKVGETRCYWSFLTADLTFIYVDPVLASHLGEQATKIIGQPFLQFVHPDERSSASADLGRIIDKKALHGGVTRVRFFRLNKVQSKIAEKDIPSQWAEAKRIAIDDSYMAVDLTMNWVSEGLILCFFHACVSLSPEDDDPHRRTNWSNWCSTPVMAVDQLQLLQERLVMCLPSSTTSPPQRVFQLLSNRGGRPLLTSWPPTSHQIANELNRLADDIDVQTIVPLEAKTSCTRRHTKIRHVPALNAEVESVYIPHGSVVFACHKVDVLSQPAPPPSHMTYVQPNYAPPYTSASYNSGYDSQSYSYSQTNSYYTGPPPPPSWSMQQQQYYPPPPPPLHGQPWPPHSPSSSPVSQYGANRGGPPPPGYMSSGGSSHPWPPPPGSHITSSSASYHDSQYYNPHPSSNYHSHPPPPPLTSPAASSSLHHHHPNFPSIPNSPPPLHSQEPSPSSPKDGYDRSSQRGSAPPSGTAPNQSGVAIPSIGGYSSKSSSHRPNGIPKCASCQTTQSPEWRKGPSGKKELCNACGLRFARSKAKKEGLGPGSGRKRKEPGPDTGSSSGLKAERSEDSLYASYSSRSSASTSRPLQDGSQRAPLPPPAEFMAASSASSSSRKSTPPPPDAYGFVKTEERGSPPRPQLSKKQRKSSTSA